MRLALATLGLALVLALPAASSAGALPPRSPAKATAPARICTDAIRSRNAGSPLAPQLKRLGELPPGDLTLTVVNQVGDCIEPVVVRQGFGAMASGIGR
jgi:hypothetical protein